MAYKDDTSNQHINLPERYSRRKINALYREIPLSDNTFRTLRKYFNAMANLYGVIPVKKAYEIISEQSSSLVTKDEFAAFAEVARHEDECYYILGRDELSAGESTGTIWDCEIIDVMLIDKYDGLDFYNETKDIQKSKPYYIPAKAQLLKYSDPFYFEETPELIAARSFFESRLKLSPDDVKYAVEQTASSVRYIDSDLSEVIDSLHDMEIDFRFKADIDRFADIYEALSNAANMQCNRGYSNNEIIRIQPQKAQEVQSAFADSFPASVQTNASNAGLPDILAAMDAMDSSFDESIIQMLSAAKQQTKRVGRNDPCPCGSGKKYKNCCGR